MASSTGAKRSTSILESIEACVFDDPLVTGRTFCTAFHRASHELRVSDKNATIDLAYIIVSVTDILEANAIVFACGYSDISENDVTVGESHDTILFAFIAKMVLVYGSRRWFVTMMDSDTIIVT